MRYHFHLHDDVDAPDLDGIELPDLDAARTHAIASARFTLAEMAKEQGRVVLHHYIDIEDETGAVLATVPFRDVVQIEEQP